MTTTTDDHREQAGKPTASELYTQRRAAGEPTLWTGFCTVPDYCTTPCTDCRRTGELSEQYIQEFHGGRR